MADIDRDESRRRREYDGEEGKARVTKTGNTVSRGPDVWTGRQVVESMAAGKKMM